jgi:hypothetical protein
MQEHDAFNLEVDNILQDNAKKKKKVNSGDKGHRAERELCKKFSERFGVPFERSVGSGNRWAQVKGMSQAAKDTLLGDISCPDGFKWVIESKSGYEDKVDFYSIWTDGNKTIDDFLKQVTDDSVRSGRKPILVYKRKLRPWLAFIRTEDKPEQFEVDYFMNYGIWTAVALESLLKESNEFWFHTPQSATVSKYQGN